MNNRTAINALLFRMTAAQKDLDSLIKELKIRRQRNSASPRPAFLIDMPTLNPLSDSARD